MEPLRSLRDVFAGLAGDESARPEGEAGGDLGDVLSAEGYSDLPETLVAEAIVSYADTAPAEVAEHLAPFVMANSPVPLDDLPPETDSAQALELLATAPTELAAVEEAPLDADDTLAMNGETDLAGADTADTDADALFALDFGEGDAATVAEPDAAELPADADEAPVESTNGAAQLEPENGTNGAFADDSVVLGPAAEAEVEDDEADDEMPDF